MQTFGSKEHQASACTVRDSEIEHRVAAVGRPANLVRFTLQAGRWRRKELEAEWLGWRWAPTSACLDSISMGIGGRHFTACQLASLDFEAGQQVSDLQALLGAWRDHAVITFALLLNTDHISHHSLLRPAGLKMFIFKRSYLASSLVTNGLESSSSFSCDVNIIIPLLSELKQRYLAKLSAFSASFFCLLSSANPYLCMNEAYSRRSHPMWATFQRNRLSSFNSITPCWTCLLVYHWLYVIISACLVLFSRLCVFATSSQLTKITAFTLWNSSCTLNMALLYSLSYSIVRAVKYLFPLSGVELISIYGQSPVLLSSASVSVVRLLPFTQRWEKWLACIVQNAIVPYCASTRRVCWQLALMWHWHSFHPWGNGVFFPNV